jgi:hypothetical protein
MKEKKIAKSYFLFLKKEEKQECVVKYKIGKIGGNLIKNVRGKR